MPRVNLSYNCDCGGRYNTVSKNTHFKTQKHTRWVQINNNYNNSNNNNDLSEEQI